MRHFNGITHLHITKVRKENSDLKRWILLISGSLFLGLGILGMFLPILPTTPFLLLAAACYARSSERFYHWLLNNRWFGKHIRNYREGKGLSLKIKILVLVMLWAAIGYSSFLLPFLWVRILLIIIAIGVTLHILSIRTLKQ
jgi:uncharacterized membrane protein YbaN (DUF454 family)